MQVKAVATGENEFDVVLTAYDNGELVECVGECPTADHSGLCSSTAENGLPGLPQQAAWNRNGMPAPTRGSWHLHASLLLTVGRPAGWCR
jgi:hypothetical protein